jgi:P22 tail accessory factor
VTQQIVIDPGGPSKLSLVTMAIEECSLAGFDFETTPEEINRAMLLLDRMMYEHPWSLLGFQHVPYGTGLPSDDSGIPFDAAHTISVYLGMRMAPRFGASLSQEARAALARSYLLLQSQYAVIPKKAYPPKTQAGAGNRFRQATFIS